MKKLLGIIILSFLCASLSFAKIIIPTHNWSSQIVGAYVIGGIFEELGYPVKYKNVSLFRQYLENIDYRFIKGNETAKRNALDKCGFTNINDIKLYI